MIGFPKHIATVEDFQNLLNDEDFKEQALEKLQQLQDFDDRVVTKAVEPVDTNKPDGDWVTEEIENPLPVHRQKGFDEWLDVVKLNAESQGKKVSELTAEYTPAEIEKTADVVVLT
jgi:hypothetical protein